MQQQQTAKIMNTGEIQSDNQDKAFQAPSTSEVASPHLNSP